MVRNGHWRVVIDIERQDGRDPQVDLVRLGKVPGHPADDALGRWLVDLRPREHIQRTRLMVDSPLVIGFPNGYGLRFSDGGEYTGGSGSGLTIQFAASEPPDDLVRGP